MNVDAAKLLNRLMQYRPVMYIIWNIDKRSSGADACVKQLGDNCLGRWKHISMKFKKIKTGNLN